jgi:pyruvate/2-oxoglutarate dehydrogenase complex dihydrolipoamide dehydrogenase (E3) component
MNQIPRGTPLRRQTPRPARIIVDLGHHHLLGATFVGPGVAELLHSATIAVTSQTPINRLWHAVACFPSISEVWLHLLKAYRDAGPSGS